LYLEEFVSSVIEAWNKFEKGKIKVSIKQLPRTMYLFTTEELLNEIKNPEKRERIVKELKLFVNTVEQILDPKEVD